MTQRGRNKKDREKKGKGRKEKKKREETENKRFLPSLLSFPNPFLILSLFLGSEFRLNAINDLLKGGARERIFVPAVFHQTLPACGDRGKERGTRVIVDHGKDDLSRIVALVRHLAREGLPLHRAHSTTIRIEKRRPRRSRREEEAHNHNTKAEGVTLFVVGLVTKDLGSGPTRSSHHRHILVGGLGVDDFTQAKVCDLAAHRAIELEVRGSAHSQQETDKKKKEERQGGRKKGRKEGRGALTPTKVFLFCFSSVNCPATPKSASLTSPFAERRMLAAFVKGMKT